MTEILILTLFLFLLLIAFATLAWLFLSLAGFAYTSVPYVPVPQSVANKVALIVDAHQHQGSPVFYDIGSGDGRVVFTVAEQLPSARVIGIEIAPVAYLTSLIRKKLSQVSNAHVLFKDARRISFSDATHVFMYLLPNVVEKMHAKLERELKKGSVVICCDFPLKEREAHETHSVHGAGKDYTLYVYTV